jgi:CRISPR-associated protein Cas2
MLISGYRAMWLLVMFDLPVKTKPQRKAATGFRKNLLRDGFWMLQFSVYARPCPSEENAEVHHSRVKRWIPNEGSVRILSITDAQFGRMKCFLGPIPIPTEGMPRQLTLF